MRSYLLGHAGRVEVVNASTWNTDSGPLLEASGFVDVNLTELNHGTAAVLEARKPA